MKLEFVPMACRETFDVGLQVAWGAVFFVHHTIRGQESGFNEYRTSNYCDWTSLISTFTIIGYDVKGDNGVFGKDKLPIFNIVKGEHVVSGFSFDDGTVFHCEMGIFMEVTSLRCIFSLKNFH